MKYAPWIVVSALVLSVIVAGFVLVRQGTWSVWFGTDAAIGVCYAKHEISTQERAAMEQAAADFLGAFERDGESASRYASIAWRGELQKGQLAEALRQFNILPHSHRQLGPMYLLQFTSGSRTGLAVPCFNGPGGQVFARRGGAPKSGIVQFTEDVGVHGGRTISIWLDYDQGQWRTRAFHFMLTEFNGRDADAFWAEAKRERAAGRAINAFLLYVITNQFMDRDAYVWRGDLARFDADWRSFERPPEIAGDAPYHWSYGGRTFEITQLQYNCVLGDGGAVLLLHHRIPPWASDAEAEAINRVLLDGYDQAHPEWRSTFNAISAEARTPGQPNGWRSVKFPDGYHDQAPTPDK